MKTEKITQALKIKEDSQATVHRILENMSPEQVVAYFESHFPDYGKKETNGVYANNLIVAEPGTPYPSSGN